MPTDSKFHGNEPTDSLKAGKFDEWLTIIGFSGTPSFLVNDQRGAQIPFYVFIFIFNSLHVSSISCSSSGETNCVNENSGNCQSVVLTQFVSPDDEHDVFETCRELKIKINT